MEAVLRWNVRVVHLASAVARRAARTASRAAASTVVQRADSVALRASGSTALQEGVQVAAYAAMSDPLDFENINATACVVDGMLARRRVPQGAAKRRVCSERIGHVRRVWRSRRPTTTGSVSSPSP